MHQVLVADDDPVTRHVVAKMLARTGCLATLACDGLEALACFDHLRFALLVTDLNMPGMDGLQLACRLKAQAPGIKVLMMTGIDPDTARNAGDGKEIDGWLFKPFGLAQLKKAMADLGL